MLTEKSHTVPGPAHTPHWIGNPAEVASDGPLSARSSSAAKSQLQPASLSSSDFMMLARTLAARSTPAVGRETVYRIPGCRSKHANPFAAWRPSCSAGGTSWRSASSSSAPGDAMSKSQGGSNWGRRAKLALGYSILAQLVVTATGLYGEYIHGPLRQSGLVDAIVDSTVYRAFPLKTNEGTPSPQRYRALSRHKNETRLLVLEPGLGPDDTIRCQLVYADLLSRRTRYDALSYVWGDPAVRSTILCDGQPTSITTNLHQALLHLRDPRKPRVLWVDALCINQEDMDERQEEVKRMALIYSRARQVLVWLGEGTPDVVDSIPAFRQLQPAFRTLHFRRGLSKTFPWLDPLTRIVLPYPALPDTTPWDAIRGLLERPWFQRTWVMQEIALARRATIILGHDTMTWDSFQDACLGISTYQRNKEPVAELSGPDVRHSLYIAYMVREIRKDRHSFWLSRRWNKPTSSFMDMLHHTRSLRCGDSRDKIFGILGIASDADPSHPALSPNYGISTAEVFKRAAIWHILHGKSLMMLSCGSDKKGSAYKLPSWVPDFTRIEDHPSMLRAEKRFGFDAALHNVVEAKVSGDGDVLILRGIAIDRVERVASLEYPGSLAPSTASKAMYPPNGVIDPALLTKTRNWLAECVAIARDGDEGEGEKEEFAVNHYWQHRSFGLSGERWNRFWRTMIWGLNAHGQPASVLYGTNIREYAAFVNKEQLRDNPGWGAGFTMQAGLAEQSLAMYTTGRRFCLTKLGTLGWVPPGTAPGDLVCVFHGGRVPFIIRQRPGGKFELIGDAFIGGWMEGPFLKLVQIKEQNFALI